VIDRAKIASRLKLARELRGYSQSQVGKILNRHQSAISRIEQGRAIDVGELVEFSQVYQVDPAYFYQAEDPDINRIFRID
jgi:transcriptional regulator with XRE-family HTH domain